MDSPKIAHRPVSGSTAESLFDERRFPVNTKSTKNRRCNAAKTLQNSNAEGVA
jgi:hypothetical protein